MSPQYQSSYAWPQMIKDKKNPDRWFAAKSMEQAEELTVFFGPKLTSFIGQDDKAHVPTGITAAKNCCKQAGTLIDEP